MTKSKSSDQKKITNLNSDSDDLKYIERIRGSDDEAFTVIFRKYYEPLYQYAGYFVGDPQIAENIVQDVFVKIWTNREKLFVQSSPKSYLYKAVKNHALNFLRREKSMVSTNELSDYRDKDNTSPEDELINKEFYEAVHQTIEKLPPKCRHIYIMKRYDNLSYMEIAEIQGISINTVKTQMRRAIKYLRKHLANFTSVLFTMIILYYHFFKWIGK